MKSDLKKSAIELRQQGLSYNDILKIIPVSKGTISIWLRNIELSSSQIQKLSQRSQAQGLGNNRNQKAWERKRQQLKDSYDPPFTNPQFMLGLGLYLGEGTKHNTSTTAITNCDPILVRIYVDWMKTFFSQDFERFSVYLHHYFPDKDKEIKQYWSQRLDIPLSNFIKSGFSVSILSNYKKGSTLIHGTAQVTACGQGVWKIRQKIQKSIDNLQKGPIV